MKPILRLAGPVAVDACFELPFGHVNLGNLRLSHDRNSITVCRYLGVTPVNSITLPVATVLEAIIFDAAITPDNIMMHTATRRHDRVATHLIIYQPKSCFWIAVSLGRVNQLLLIAFGDAYQDMICEAASAT